MARPTNLAPIPVSLRRQFPDASFVGCAEIVVSDATDRSSECRPGCLFAALPGTSVHGSKFVPQAVARGASAILTSHPLADVAIPQCIVRDPRKAYAEICHTLRGWPTRRLGCVGVTGTNGKTSVTWLVRSILKRLGEQCGLIGTVEYNDGVDSEPASLTTPDAATLAGWLSRMVSQRTRFAAVELSSHGLDQSRAAGTQLDVAIVTNLTQDHFDYHGSFSNYLAAKSRIAHLLKRGGRYVLNADDPRAEALMGAAPETAQVVTYGIDQPADLVADDLRVVKNGVEFTVRSGIRECRVRLPLVGRHNVSNCLAAIGAVSHFGFELDEICRAAQWVAAPPGRLEAIECGQPFRVLVDYAHTPDALERAIAAVRPLTPGRIVCVFGAGGDRDRSKRPLMGMAVAGSDLAVITSDNPRKEDPAAIIRDILSGITVTATHVEADREQGIRWALEQAAPGDTVLIAGKGHEAVQIVGDKRIPFQDGEVCRRILSERHPHLHGPRSKLRQPA